MKFKSDIFMLNRGDCIIVFGDDAALKISGPIKEDIAKCIEEGSDYLQIFRKLSKSDELNSVVEIINEYLSETDHPSKSDLASKAKIYRLDQDNVVEVLDLTASTDMPASLEVYAKYVDPTSVVGPGGYDDDTPCM